MTSAPDLHAFTALGVCLPIVLACWRARRGAVDQDELRACAERHGVAGFERILEWARRAEPRFENEAAREAYLRKAALPAVSRSSMTLWRIAASSWFPAT